MYHRSLNCYRHCHSIQPHISTGKKVAWRIHWPVSFSLSASIETFREEPIRSSVDIDNSSPCSIPTNQNEDTGKWNACSNSVVRLINTHACKHSPTKHFFSFKSLTWTKTLDLDYYVPPPIREERATPSPSPANPQQRTVTIKTMDLFPGSTTFLTDEPKPPVDPVPNFSFMNAKALMSPLQFNGNSTGQSTTLFWSAEYFLLFSQLLHSDSVKYDLFSLFFPFVH